jgi:hypothetical protein
VIPDTLDHMTQGKLQSYENIYKTLNLITTALGRNVYDRVAHLVSYPGSKKHRTEASIRVPRMFNHTHSNNMINR